MGRDTLIIVESDIPLTRDRSVSKKSTWDPGEFPFDDMEVGDSFAVSPPDGVDLIYVQNKVTGAMSKMHKETDKRFTTRQRKDGTVRCWRID